MAGLCRASLERRGIIAQRRLSSKAGSVGNSTTCLPFDAKEVVRGMNRDVNVTARGGMVGRSRGLYSTQGALRCVDEALLPNGSSRRWPVRDRAATDPRDPGSRPGRSEQGCGRRASLQGSCHTREAPNAVAISSWCTRRASKASRFSPSLLRPRSMYSSIRVSCCATS